MSQQLPQEPQPLHKGRFVFQGIQEGEGEGRRTIIFKPPLNIHYSIWEKKNAEGGDNYPEDVPILAYATYDFGLEMMTPLDAEHNWLVNGYEGLSKESPLEDVLMKTLWYDLFHAFCHPTQDPNYSHYNWALKGWLKERAIVQEEFD